LCMRTLYWYFYHILKRWHSKFRISAHELEIERRRYKKLK
jgi:hypothetical protein